jgi:hypothetical protein
MGGCSGVLGLGRKHPLRIALNWTKKASQSKARPHVQAHYRAGMHSKFLDELEFT